MQKITVQVALIFVGVLTVLNLNAQKSFSAFVKDSAVKFRINISPLTFAIGPTFTTLKSEMTTQSTFLLANNSLTFFTFSPDIQFIFKDKIGFDLGFELFSGILNKKKIRNEFQNQVQGYNIKIAESNNVTGDNPFTSGYNFRMYKAGLVWFVAPKKWTKLVYGDFLYNIENWYPGLQVQFTQPNTGYSFTRNYQFDKINSVGFKVGAGLRGYYKPADKAKHTRLSIEIHAEFVYLNMSGFGYYVDKDATGNQLTSSSNRFNQTFYGFYLGFTLSGLDFHW